MKSSITLFLVFILFQGSCYSQGNKPVTIRLTKANLEQSSSNMSEVIDEISYIKLETSSEAIIGQASNYHIERMRDCFCIYHSRCNEPILLFEEDGKFRCKIGRIGKGPGEYSGVFTVYFDKYLNQILVLQGKQVQGFDLLGNHISTIEILSKGAQVRGMAIVDQSHWMFSFFEPGENEEIQAGVIMTDKNGAIIKKFIEFDSSIPGCSGKHALSNRIYSSGKDIYFCPFDYNKTYHFNGETWGLSYIVDGPFKKPPGSLYKSRRSELMKFKIDNGLLMNVRKAEEMMIVEGATPKSFNIVVDLLNGHKYFSSYFMDFHMEGLKNDIDGGMPFYISSIDDGGHSYNLIDSPKLIEYKSKRLLNPDGESHGKYMSLKDVLKDSKVEDNPIIVVAHIISN